MKTDAVFRTNPVDVSDEDAQYGTQSLPKLHKHFTSTLNLPGKIEAGWVSGDIDSPTTNWIVDGISNFDVCKIDSTRRRQMEAYARAIKRAPGCCGLFRYGNTQLVGAALNMKLAEPPTHRLPMQAPADDRERFVGGPVVAVSPPLLSYPVGPSGTSVPREEGHQPVFVPGIPDRQSMKGSLDRNELDSLVSRLEMLRTKITDPHSTYRALVFNEKAARAYAAGRDIDEKIDEKVFRHSLQSTVDRIPAGFTCFTQDAKFRNGFDNNSKGWLHIYSKGADEHTSRRIYLNVSPDAAAGVFAFVVGHVIGNTKSPGKIGVKIQLPPGLYVRNHQMVVFCNEMNEDDVKRVLAGYSRENRDFS